MANILSFTRSGVSVETILQTYAVGVSCNVYYKWTLQLTRIVFLDELVINCESNRLLNQAQYGSAELPYTQFLSKNSKLRSQELPENQTLNSTMMQLHARIALFRD